MRRDKKDVGGGRRRKEDLRRIEEEVDTPFTLHTFVRYSIQPQTHIHPIITHPNSLLTYDGHRLQRFVHALAELFVDRLKFLRLQRHLLGDVTAGEDRL